MLEIVINLSTAQLCVEHVQHATPIVCYPIAHGKPSSPTPTGQFEITRAVKNPVYVSCDGRVIGGGFLGSVALVTNHQLSDGCYLAIHGTNRPELIGKPVSAGCVRMTNLDINHLTINYLKDINRIKIK